MLAVFRTLKSEEEVWKHFNGLLGEKYLKKELKKLQDRMKETSQWQKP